MFENTGWLVVVPWWATWPFEVLVLAKRCVGCLPELNAEEAEGLAEVLGQVTRRYDNLFETSFPYSEPPTPPWEAFWFGDYGGLIMVGRV